MALPSTCSSLSQESRVEPSVQSTRVVEINIYIGNNGQRQIKVSISNSWARKSCGSRIQMSKNSVSGRYVFFNGDYKLRRYFLIKGNSLIVSDSECYSLFRENLVHYKFVGTLLMSFCLQVDLISFFFKECRK